MQTIKTLSLVVLPALLLSGEAAARDHSQSGPAAGRCWETDCKLATNGPELTGARAVSGRATVSAVRLPGRRPPTGIGGSCPPFMCGSDGNGPELTSTRTGSGRATVSAVRLPGRRPPAGIGGSCPPFMCGSDGNGPELTGLAKPVVLDPVPPPGPRPLPVPYPHASSLRCWQVTDWYEICW